MILFRISFRTPIVLLLLFILFSCEEKSTKKLILEEKQSQLLSPFSSSFHKLSDSIEFITSSKDTFTSIDSFRVLFNGQTILSTKGRRGFLPLQKIPNGKQQIFVEVFSSKGKDTHSLVLQILANSKPKTYQYKIIASYPHDTKAYTQGLVYRDGYLFESTGLYKQSSIRKTNYKTGEIIQKQLLEDKYFGEGMVIANDKIYMLTWNEKVGLVYSLKDFSFLHFFNLPSNEGWGMASGNAHFYVSDGSSFIHLLDTSRLNKLTSFQVVDDKKVYTNINEMEWIEGILYANIYTTHQIIMIDPSTGIVSGIIDCSGLLAENEIKPETDVLNGIAYIPEKKHFLITGKNWPKMFEVVWVEKK